MSTVATILAGVQQRVWKDGTTFSTVSEPTEAEAITWLNEDLRWLAGICAQEGSELGRTLGSVTTAVGVITAATQANPCNITVATHGLSSGDEILIIDVLGMTELNGFEYTVTRIDANNLTIGINSSAYSAYTSDGTIIKTKYNLSSSLMNTAQRGYIAKSTERPKVTLTTEEALTEYSPTDINQPEEFYITSGNLVSFLPRPDDVYTIKIPYWGFPTTLTAPTDTVPFYGIFDNLLIESLTMRIQNRDEYDLSNELRWFGFLNSEARKLIHMRRGLKSGISL